MFCKFKNLLTRLVLRNRRITSSGDVFFKSHSSAKIEVEKEFVFGVATLSDCSPKAATSILILEEQATLKVASAAVGRGTRIKLGNRAMMVVGSGTYLSDNCLVSIGTSLSIGNQCAISWDVQIIDDDGHQLDSRPRKAPISIGNNVWIGSRAIILKGAELGDGCVVAAGAVVSGKFPPRSLIGGVPARIIREDVSWS